MKKKTLKSRLALILAAALCLSSLAACDLLPDEPPELSDSDSEAFETTQAASEIDTEHSDSYTEGLEFTRDRSTNEYSVTGYHGSSVIVEVPKIYKGNPVTSIAKNAFFKTEAEIVKLPDSIKEIGENAFKNAPQLREVYIGKSETELCKIGKDAFFSCNALETIFFFGDDGDWESVSLGKNWDKNAGSSTAEGTYHLYIVDSEMSESEDISHFTDVVSEEITESESVPVFESESESAEDTETHTRWEVDSETVNTPEWTTEATDTHETESTEEYETESVSVAIDSQGIEYAFDHDRYGYVVYDRGSFSGVDVVIPKTLNGYKVIDILENAFADCADIKSISLSANIEIIGDDAFKGCTSLETVYYELDESDWTMVCILSGNEYLLNAEIVYNYGRYSEGLDYIFDDAAGYYIITGIGSCFDEDVIIPETINGLPVGAIGDVAFGSAEIKSITIPATVQSIGINAIPPVNEIIVSNDNPYFKSVLGDLYTNDGKTLIRYAANKSGTSFALPYGVETVLSNAFSGSRRLKTVTLSDTVTSMEEYAFGNYSNITELILGDGIQGIDERFFVGLQNMIRLDVGDGVKYLSFNAFSGCDKLESLSLGKSVESIDRQAFFSKSSLVEIIVDESNPNFKSLDGVLYSKDGKTLVKVGAGVTCDSFMVMDGVQNIGDYAFENCFIDTVVLPDSVVSIGKHAFRNSTIQSITMREGLEYIGAGAFEGTLLKSITIPTTVFGIDMMVFRGCTQLESIEVADGCREFYSVDGVLYDNDNAVVVYPAGKTDTSYRFPDSVSAVWDHAFYNNDYLEVLIAPKVIEVGAFAFEDCDKLELVVCHSGALPYFYGDDVDMIVTNNSSLEGLEFEVVNDQYHVMGKGRDDVGAVIIPSTYEGTAVTAIGPEAFMNNENITYIYIPESVTTISEIALMSCTSLLYIDVSEDNECFKSVDGVLYSKDGSQLIRYPLGRDKASYSIPEGVEVIAPQAFRDAEKLLEVMIGNDVTTIGDYSFAFCTQMTGVYIPEGVETIGFGAFYGCWNINNVVIPDSVRTIGGTAFSNCSSLSNITVGSGVESIGRHFVEYCYGAETLAVNYRGSEEDWQSIDIDEDNSYLSNSKITFNYTGKNGAGFDGNGDYSFNVDYNGGSVSATVKENGFTEININQYGLITVTTTESKARVDVTLPSGHTVEDTPAVLLMVKNFCTCSNISECYALETVNIYAMTGDNTVISDKCKIRELDMCWDPTYINGEGYLYFFCDMSDYGFEGAINGLSFEFVGLDNGKQEFQLLKIGLFESTDDAEAYAEDWLS